MGKGIFTYYKERLIEIGGNSKCLYLKNVVKKSSYDLGRIFEGRGKKVSEFVDFLWSGGKFSLSVLNKDEMPEILQNIEHQRKPNKIDEGIVDPTSAEGKKILKDQAEDRKRLFENEVIKIKELKRETEEIERETGRYEMYVGYPFVFGSISQGAAKTLIKAPLLLFPVKIDIIDDYTVELTINHAEKVHINHALVFAYAQARKLNIEQLDLEYDNISSAFKNVKDITDYLAKAYVKIECQNSKNIYNYSKFIEPDTKSGLSVRYGAVLGRFPLSNSIYNDYTILEKKKLTNDAVIELLRTQKATKLSKIKSSFMRMKEEPDDNSYTVKMLDYAQSEVVKKIDKSGNVVIYGPPGTGKSQTIVNIVTDSVCKGKKVLVVSQKKAALDVVYNRLGILSDKAMYILDESKEKRAFYEKCNTQHQKSMNVGAKDLSELHDQYNEIQDKIDAEEKKLHLINDTLNKKRSFGISLLDMYSSSYNLSKASGEYGVYTKMLEEASLMAMSHKELSEAMFGIKAMNLSKLYYDFMQNKEKNPLIDNLRPNIDLKTLGEVKAKLEQIQKSRKGLFNTAKYPYYRQILAFYPKLSSEDTLNRVVSLEARIEHPNSLFLKKKKEDLREIFKETMKAMEEFVKEYDCLNYVLTLEGYVAVIDNILRGNTSYIKLVYEALDNYIAFRDLNRLLESLDANKLCVLNFAYSACKNEANYNSILDSVIRIRIYHEILKLEEECKDDLAMLVDFNNITEKIYKLKETQLGIAYQLCSGRSNKSYTKLYESRENNKDYLHQISKSQKFWPIRKMMEVYGEYALSLFPCWLLSPENVSSLLPLEKNLFDVVIFDEASQVFIENTIPTIYRGRSIVVAGDEKQLRPSATFMKRYLGADPEMQEDYAVQAALEVDSLLDLAVSRYDSANLTYHYRSKYQELIDFSNCAFYSSGLQIAPNISKNLKNRPIVRHKVDGKWIDRKNAEEAKKVVDVLKDIFKTRKNNESIGIITFNTEQQSCIADMIDKEKAVDNEFRSAMLKETNRFENGEDTSIFIKNLENVQGDERDIIIFSIGYAPNEEGKVHTAFGSLSMDGGENRLNVAITRAKTKIIVVTSIEPEDLKVDGAKNQGPKLLKKYLAYVRAVSKGDNSEVSAILNELSSRENKQDILTDGLDAVEEQIKEKLTKLGYDVDTQVGNGSNKISLAVYDKATDKYLVGVELDKDAFKDSESCMERDVYKPKFLEARGWNIVRVWCRDWWLYPQKVIKTITQIADKAKAK